MERDLQVCKAMEIWCHHGKEPSGAAIIHVVSHVPMNVTRLLRLLLQLKG